MKGEEGTHTVVVVLIVVVHVETVRAVEIHVHSVVRTVLATRPIVVAINICLCFLCEPSQHVGQGLPAAPLR